jgi:hypothetical protein
MADEPDSSAKRIWEAFLREAPWMLGIWVVATLALIVFGLLSGDLNPRQALRVTVGFLPLAIPLAPLTWLRFEPAARTSRQVRISGFGCLWAVVTMPLALALGLMLTRLVGGE